MPEITKDQINDFIYDSAIEDLYLGYPAPWDREILSSSPLPDDITEPFFTQSVNIRDVMNTTFFSLSGWISESKKTNYFSDRFVTLSKLIHKGVLSMGRGLVTLYNRGEDLSCAPMQIGDLISAASYQFRKSYLGVLQTSAKFPEIGEKLLINQLNWSDLLLRLFRTRDKLNEPNTRKIAASLPDNTAESSAYDLQKAFDPDSAGALEGFSETELQEFSSFGGISPAAAFSAYKPARAISPARALSSLDRTRRQKHSGKRKLCGSINTEAAPEIQVNDINQPDGRTAEPQKDSEKPASGTPESVWEESAKHRQSPSRLPDPEPAPQKEPEEPNETAPAEHDTQKPDGNFQKTASQTHADPDHSAEKTGPAPHSRITDTG